MVRLVGAVSVLVAFAFLISCQRMDSAAEPSAIVTLKTISTTQQTYAVSHDGSYGSFQQLCEAGKLDSRFNSTNPQVGGYIFSMRVGDKFFSCNADPAPGSAAVRHFYIDSTSGEIHANRTQPASSTDLGLDQ